ncbi:hypothetical protein [Dyadobacter sp. 676]|uniref:DUF4234 domain-containing protein n=1 Tax=Dyadobacter sp. 676 TaxID=3088362 RepID=A0AAU8FIV5_9BACT
MKIFEIFICTGMIGDKSSPELRAVNAAKWTFSYVLSLIYFVILKLLWISFGIKIGEIMYYLLLFSTVFISWSLLNSYYYNKVNKAKKIVESNYSKGSIKLWGYIGGFIVFIAPLCLLIIGIPLVSNYKNW